MNRQYVNWKTVLCKNVVGEDFASRLPGLIDSKYNRTLLARIIEMPKKDPISFTDAVRMVSDKFSGPLDYEPGHAMWCVKNFVNWISDQGFHIELSGDEFEPFVMSDKVM